MIRNPSRFFRLASADPAIGEWCMPALLQTCKEIRAEASAIHFSNHAFNYFQHPHINNRDYLLAQWLAALEPTHQAMIRRIYLGDYFYCEPEHAVCRIKACHASLLAAGARIPEDVLFKETLAACCNGGRCDVDHWMNVSEVVAESHKG